MKPLVVTCLLSLVTAPALAASAPPASAPELPLSVTIELLDDAVFDAFNRCQDPAQLAKHASYFDPAVEFYHDTGGVTWTREAMLANTAKYVCGHFTRQRVQGSLQVFPIKDFGAIAQGQHRFCDTASGKCEGLADYSMVWRLHEGQWQITRVLSYGHRTVAHPSQP